MQGFDVLAWTVVALQIFGGLIVGMVVKYADNILKNFANALSVIFTVIGAMPLFGQYPSIFFLFGVMGVLLSVFMYGKSTPSGFGAFESCYRTTSIANLQLLLQSGPAGECCSKTAGLTMVDMSVGMLACSPFSAQSADQVQVCRVCRKVLLSVCLCQMY